MPFETYTEKWEFWNSLTKKEKQFLINLKYNKSCIKSQEKIEKTLHVKNLGWLFNQNMEECKVLCSIEKICGILNAKKKVTKDGVGRGLYWTYLKHVKDYKQNSLKKVYLEHYKKHGCVKYLKRYIGRADVEGAKKVVKLDVRPKCSTKLGKKLRSWKTEYRNGRLHKDVLAVFKQANKIWWLEESWRNNSQEYRSVKAAELHCKAFSKGLIKDNFAAIRSKYRKGLLPHAAVKVFENKGYFGMLDLPLPRKGVPRNTSRLQLLLKKNTKRKASQRGH